MSGSDLRKTLRLYTVLGEASGDQLAAHLLDSLRRKSDVEVNVFGLGGPMMAKRGLVSLFEIDDIAVMGFAPVLQRLPTLIQRVYQTVADIIERQPDVVLLVDSPEFCAAVAKRVRRRAPHIAIVKYVCPSVWAWRPGRAPKLKRYIDHVLALLPFEPAALEKLQGPSSTYVGHPLAHTMGEYRDRPMRKLGVSKQPLTLALLPGSRKAEIARSLPVFCRVAKRMTDVSALRLVLPNRPQHRRQIETILALYDCDVDLYLEDGGLSHCLEIADAALATSGTISLELGLAHIPHAVFYDLDWIAKRLTSLVTSWSVNLPNLIVDRVVVPELVGQFATEERLYREALDLVVDGPKRDTQAAGFVELWENVSTETPPADLAADAVLKVVTEK